MNKEKQLTLQEIAQLIGEPRLLGITDRIQRTTSRRGSNAKLGDIREGIAAAFGYRDWNGLVGSLKNAPEAWIQEVAQAPAAQTLSLTGWQERARYLNSIKEPGEVLRLVSASGLPVLYNEKTNGYRALLSAQLELGIDQRNDYVDEQLDIVLEGLDYELVSGTTENTWLITGTAPEDDDDWYAAEYPESFTGPCISFEYDRRFFGGDYSGVGAFVYVPVILCQAFGDAEAFEMYTGLDPQHIVHYSQDECFTASGEAHCEG